MNAKQLHILRELTEDELLLISGGSSSGSHSYRGSDTYYPPDSGSGGGGTFYPPDPGGGDGSSGYPSSGGAPNQQTPPDTHIDCAAQHLRDAINQKSDHHYTEYEGLIYVNMDGSVHTSSILPTGQSGGSSGGTNYSYSDFGVPNDSFVIGIVHNHPDLILQDPNTGATEPSANPAGESVAGYGDMKTLNDFHNGYTATGYPFNPDDVRLYIDFDGKTNNGMTEYDWNDQDMSHLQTDANRPDAPWAKQSNYEPDCQS